MDGQKSTEDPEASLRSLMGVFLFLKNLIFRYHPSAVVFFFFQLSSFSNFCLFVFLLHNRTISHGLASTEPGPQDN